MDAEAGVDLMWRVSEANELVVPVEVNHDVLRPLRTVWSWFDHQTALEDAGFTAKEWLPVREAFLAVYKADGLVPKDERSVSSIAVFCETIPTVPEKVKELLVNVLNEMEHIGGDDGFFDYFPDKITIADQVIQAVHEALPVKAGELFAALTWVRQTAVNFRYYTEGEYLDLVGADGTYLQTREQYLRRGWLAPINDIFGTYRYTQKFRNEMAGDNPTPDWMFT